MKTTNDTYEDGNPYGDATTILGRLEQQVEWAHESRSEITAEFRNEVALFGDGWAGGQDQLDGCSDYVRKAEAALAGYVEQCEQYAAEARA